MDDEFAGKTEAELRELDAMLAGQDSDRWDTFYGDRARPCPFFVEGPDESLAEWIAEWPLAGGRAIDLGCGNARNAIFLARHGYAVDAVDYSQTAIEWAKERIAQAAVPVTLRHRSVFDLDLATGSCDLIYDSGCFHHVAPHRRARYVDLVVDALEPGGWFGLTCFRPEGGSGYADDEVYAHRSLGGGLGFSEERLREIWSGSLDIRVLRPMMKPADDSGLFGETFLWVLLARKN